MANHVRTQIRDAIVGLLTGLATTGNNVFKSRVKTLADTQLPGLIVLTNDEEVAEGNFTSSLLLDRVLSVEVIAKAKAADALDDALDTIMKEVESAVYASVESNTLNNLCKGISLSGISVELDAQGEKPVGQATMTFNVTYNTMAAAPDVSI